MNPFAKAVEPSPQHEGPYELARDGGRSGGRGPKGPSHTYHTDTFVTFQPWQECALCHKTYTESSTPPEKCPHTRLEAYLALRNRMIVDRTILVIADRTQILKTGLVMTHVEWAEPVVKAKAEPAKKGPSRL